MITVKDVVELPESYETDREDIVYSKEDIDNLPVKIEVDVEKLAEIISIMRYEVYLYEGVGEDTLVHEDLDIAQHIAENIEDIIKKEK